MKSKFGPKIYVKTYIAAREGCNNNKIAHTLGVQFMTFKHWLDKYPLLQWCIDLGRGNIRDKRGNKIGGETFHDYVYGRLDPKCQQLWDKINLVNDEDSKGLLKDITQGKGKKMMQSLFVHALICANFNRTEACRKIGISASRLETWLLEIEFRSLLQNVQEVKKDFCEAALMQLIQEKDSAATIFANSTLNKDRGYSRTIQVEHSGVVRHDHIDVNELNLPIDIKRMIVEAIRVYKNRVTQPTKELVLAPARVTEVEEDI